ncbi:MAG: hypothetical protein ABI406_10825 [Ktedonobacteraceae bacterium]
MKSAERIYEREGVMFHERRRIQLPVAGAILLCLLVGVYLFAIRRSAKPDPASSIEKHTVDGSAGDALKYWTKDRMRKAKPAKLPHINGGGKGKQNPQSSPHTSKTDNSD